MKFVNLTPHAITLQSPDGSRTVVPPSGTVARVVSTPGTRLDCAAYDAVPVPLYDRPTWGAVEGLPPESDDTLYIVSALVAQRCGGRADVFAPGTGPADGAVRNAAGQIEAVTRLVRG